MENEIERKSIGKSDERAFKGALAQNKIDGLSELMNRIYDHDVNC